MKIYVKESGKTALRIFIPTSFLTGWLGRTILKALISQKVAGMPELTNGIDQLELKVFQNELKRISKKYKGLELVDIADSKGTIVKVRI